MLVSLLRFHLQVGARLAMRAAAPLVGLPAIVLLVQQDPAAAVRGLATLVFAPPGRTGGALAIAGVAILLASWAVPRVTFGMTGWMRHLPVSGAAHRRAALAALVAAQAPLAAMALLLAPFAGQLSSVAFLGRAAAVLLTLAAAALIVWPGAPARRSRPLALLATVMAAAADLTGILAATGLLLASERLAGSLAPATRPLRERRRLPLPVSVLVSLRALGATFVAAHVQAAVPLAIAVVFRHNNPGLPPAVAAGAARLGGGLAVAFLASALVERLAVRRPVWCWARSLPAGAARRIDEDALLLGTPCLVLLAVVAWMDASAALWVAMCVPAVALRGAGAIRRSGETRLGPAMPMFAEGALLAGLLALLPWLGLVALAVAPSVRRVAADADRCQRVSRWEERHHSAAGDAQAWSAR